jgi:hypothetical protein
MKKLLLTALLILAGAITTNAQTTTYTYVGPAFTGFTGGYACPSICNISGSFTTAAPLPANLTFAANDVSVASFSFTDGSNVESSSNGAYFSSLFIGTDANGNINQYEVDVRSTEALVFRNANYDADVTYPSCCGGPPEAYTINVASGVWTTVKLAGKQFWILESAGSNPLAQTETAGNTYGSSGWGGCTPATPCAQPLFVTFDTNNGVAMHLPAGSSGGNDALTETNAIDSGDAGITSLSVSSYCPSEPGGFNIADTNEDGNVYNFGSTYSTPCAISPTTLLGTAPGQASFSTTLTSFPDPSTTPGNLWDGTFDSALEGTHNPVNATKSGSGTSTLAINVNPDFSVSATLTLPAGAATYSYAGPQFNNFQAPATCPSVCNILGSFTVAVPLAANLVYPRTILPESFSFTDGVDVFTQTSVTGAVFQVGTDANGNLSSWYVALSGTDSTGQYGTFLGMQNSGSFKEDLAQPALGQAMVVGGLGAWRQGLNSCFANDTFTTSDSHAINNGVIPGVDAAVISGDVVSMSLGNGNGDVLWLVASNIDTNDNLLTDGSMIITGYVAANPNGRCPNTYFWDAPFSRQSADHKKPHKFDPIKHHRHYSSNRWMRDFEEGMSKKNHSEPVAAAKSKK